MSGVTDAAQPHRTWGYVHGESHTALEDSILTSIDADRGAIAARMPCAQCGKSDVQVSVVRGKLMCRICRATNQIPMPEVLTPTGQNKRRGMYYVQIPSGVTPSLVYAVSKKVAAGIVARQMDRKRLPKGTRIWSA